MTFLLIYCPGFVGFGESGFFSCLWFMVLRDELYFGMENIGFKERYVINLGMIIILVHTRPKLFFKLSFSISTWIKILRRQWDFLS